VQHVSLGVGKVVAVEAAAVHVFFPGSDKRFAAKLRLPVARPLLKTDGIEPNPWLAGLTAFALDPESGRYALAASWLTHEQAVEQFLAAYPKGFADPAYLGSARPSRVSRWRAAQAAWGRRLGQAEAEQLLEEGDLGSLVGRLLEIDRLVARHRPGGDVDAVKEALSDEEATRPYLAALVKLLSVPSPSRARFEALFAAARCLPVEPPTQWLMATLFPFVAAPERHVLLQPRFTCSAAQRLGWDLSYEPSPTWATYAATRASASQLLARLGSIGATDFADVEAFLHVVATARRSAQGT